jgi:hypothetical protein
MRSMRLPRAMLFIFSCLWFTTAACPRSRAQAALLLEGADGISRTFDPTGHVAIYFSRICAASPMRLRRCGPGELGSVIARYEGIGGYDWLAVPLIPYLYSVEDAGDVPKRVNHETVQALRMSYHDAHLMSLGKDVAEGGRVKRGWNQLPGASYERKTYAFRFDTTAGQDDALIASMNAAANRSHFNIVFGNCANFADAILNFYFPHTFRRHIVPDGGIVTPRQVAYQLVRYGRKHPGIRLTVLEIPQIPGYRRPSRVGKSVAESLIVTGYVVPIAVLNPFVAAGVIADDLAWGRDPLPLKHAQVLDPEDLAELANPASSAAKTLAEGVEASSVPRGSKIVLPER